MAGAYMDPPEERMAWDRDGSILASISSAGVITAQSLAVRQAINAETEVNTSIAGGSASLYLAVVFPIPMDMKAIFYSSTSPSITTDVQTSKDTTNGLDGTWTTQISAVTHSAQTKPNYRQATDVKLLNPTSASDDVRGIRIKSVSSQIFGFKALHLYGYPASSATKDRLALWHPIDNARLPAGWFDWGNTPRSSSADRQFRIKNLSPALTANDIDLYIEALTPGSPTVAGMHTLSSNGTTFQSALNLPVLAPGATSGVLTLRRTVPANAQVSVWSARLAADVDNWS